MSDQDDMTTDERLEFITGEMFNTYKNLTAPDVGGALAPSSAMKQAIERHAEQISQYHNAWVDELVAEVDAACQPTAMTEEELERFVDSAIEDVLAAAIGPDRAQCLVVGYVLCAALQNADGDKFTLAWTGHAQPRYVTAGLLASGTESNRLGFEYDMTMGGDDDDE